MSRAADNPFGQEDENPFDDNSGSFDSDHAAAPKAAAAAPKPAAGASAPASSTTAGGVMSRATDGAASARASIGAAASGAAAQARDAAAGATRAVDAKKAALERRVKELELREKAIAAREAVLPRLRPPNWPVCFKILHHDIENDIPSDGQRTVKTAYTLWYSFAFVTFFNMVAYIVILADPFDDSGNKALGMTIAVILLLLGVPVSFFLWYRPLYSGVRTSRASLFVLFFFMIVLNMVLCIIGAVGLPGTGGAGFILALRAFADKSKAAGVFCIIAALFWIAQLIFSMLAFKRGYSQYRSRGLTFADAKKDMQKSAITAAL